MAIKQAHRVGPGLLAGLLSSLALAPALATELDRVEITGSAPLRYDIVQTCPSIVEQLGDALAGKVARHLEYGVTEVTLSLGPQGISDIQARGGPFVYRSALRRAVRLLDCQQAMVGQRFRFQVAFVAESDTPPPGMARAAGLLHIAAAR